MSEEIEVKNEIPAENKGIEGVKTGTETAPKPEPEPEIPAENTTKPPDPFSVFDYMKAPKQQYQETIEKTDPETPEPQPEKTAETTSPGSPTPDGLPTKVSGINNTSGKLVAKTIDIGFGKVGNVVTGYDAKRYRADEEDMDALIEIWGLYFEENGGRPPAWVLLLMVILMVYAPKIPLIIKDVKRNKEIKQEAMRRAHEERIVREREANPDADPQDVQREDVIVPVNLVPEKRMCLNCGEVDLKPSQGKFCSKSCSTVYNNEIRRRKKDLVPS